MATSPLQRFGLLLTLLLTAASSLSYELVWTRKLSHVFGTSALAESAVLAVFMGGLALGSLFGGQLLLRYGRRSRYRFLALLELGIAVSCLATLGAIAAMQRSYPALLELAGGEAGHLFNVILFGVTALVLVVPTFLIGVAFPSIVQVYHDAQRHVGNTVGSCYMVDTIGGALGLLIAAYFLIARFGFFNVSLLASLINLILALYLWNLFRAGDDSPPRESERSAEDGPVVGSRRWLAPVVFFCTGFAALGFEVVWIRHTALIYGGSLYAFAAVVISFLAGLGLGSWLYNRLLDSIRDKVRLFGAILLLIAVGGMLVTAILPRFEQVFLRLYEAIDSYPMFIAALTLLCIGVMLPTTILMGATLPVISAVYASGSRIGIDVGRLFAINSFGALFGSFVTGFFVVPWLGIDAAALVPAAIYLGCSAIFVLAFERSPHRRVAQALAFVLIGLLGVTAWSAVRKADHLYNGAFYLGTVYEDYLDEYLEEQVKARDSLRFLRHSPYGQVAVYGEEEVTLTNNGKIEFSSDPAGLLPRDIMAHASFSLHEGPRDALIVGMGGGWTLAAMLRHSIQSVSVVEINAVVVQANREVLPDYNDDALADPRTRVIVSDGRNFMAGTSERFDLVLSEPPEIWVSGVSSLWTDEFYRSVKRVLRPGGLFCQWVPRYDMSESDYRIALNTMSQSFPYLYEFDMAEVTGLGAFRELLVVASAAPLDPVDRISGGAVSLDDLGSPDFRYLKRMSALASGTFRRGDDELQAWIAGTTRVNTDDLPVLEFHTLRNRFRKFHAGAP